MGKMVNLKIDGKKVVLGGPGKEALKILAVVKKLKKGEYLTCEGLAERMGCNPTAITSNIVRAKALFERNRLFITTPEAPKVMVYGCEASIVALRKELEMN